MDRAIKLGTMLAIIVAVALAGSAKEKEDERDRGRYGTSTLPFSDPEERLYFERALFFSTDHSPGQHTLKVTRARNTHWVSARIDADDPNLFVFEPRIVPANANWRSRTLLSWLGTVRRDSPSGVAKLGRNRGVAPKRGSRAREGFDRRAADVPQRHDRDFVEGLRGPSQDGAYDVLMVAREVPADDRRSQWVVAFSIHGGVNINIDATAESTKTVQ